MPFEYFSLVSCKKGHLYTLSIPFFSVGIDRLANSCDANFIHVFSGTKTGMFKFCAKVQKLFDLCKGLRLFCE